MLGPKTRYYHCYPCTHCQSAMLYVLYSWSKRESHQVELDSRMGVPYLSRRTWPPTKGFLLPERTLYPPFTPAQARVVDRCNVFCCQLSMSGSSRGLFEEVPVRSRITPVVDQGIREYSPSTRFGLGQCRTQHNSRYPIAAEVKVLARSIHCRK